MKYEEYLRQRQELSDKAQALINEGKTEEAEAVMNDITALDARYEEACRQQANLTALNGSVKSRANSVLGSTGEPLMQDEDGKAKEPEAVDFRSDAYLNAWVNKMQGRKLTQAEADTIRMVNEEFTHTTGNTGEVIPETVTKGIWKEVEDMYPFYADVAKTNVTGTLTMVIGDTSTDAKWYEETTETEDGKETFKTLTLNGCELARAITVSWKLKKMARAEFLPYIQRRMAEKMGAACGYGVTHGAGVVTGKPSEPKGIVTAIEAEKDTPRVVKYKTGALAWKNITDARKKIKSGYTAGLAVYANSNTIWGEIASCVDGMGRPLFMAGTGAGSVGHITGLAVKEDGSMKDGEILIGNANRGYTVNINEGISMQTEDHVTERTTDYAAYAIIDGAPVTLNAFAMLKAEAAEVKA